MSDHRSMDASSVRPRDLVIEANHRIANHLAALVSILKKEIAATLDGPESIPREQVVDVLAEMAGKILAVSRLHHSLAVRPTQGEVDLNNILKSILDELETSGIFGDRLRINSTLRPGCLVESSHALLLAFAFSEIVTNAMKYAHPSGLPVELSIAGASTSDGGVALQIADDGVGLPEDFDESRDAGVGLKLLRSLVENSGGRLETNSDALGLSFSIELPPVKPRAG
jgi:two-component sensor histidine kinase